MELVRRRTFRITSSWTLCSVLERFMLVLHIASDIKSCKRNTSRSVLLSCLLQLYKGFLYNGFIIILISCIIDVNSCSENHDAMMFFHLPISNAFIDNGMSCKDALNGDSSLAFACCHYSCLCISHFLSLSQLFGFCHWSL